MNFSIAGTLTEELALHSDQLDPSKINWSLDWWKWIIIAFSALLFFFLVLRLTLYVLRLAGVLCCVCVGVAGGWFVWQFLVPKVIVVMPETLQPYTAPVLCTLGFLACFAVASGIMVLVRQAEKPLADAPAASSKKKKKKADEED